MAASRLPVTSAGSCHPRPPRLLIPPATPTGQHVYLTATKIWYRLKRFSGTKCHNIHVLYHLKRFLGTVCYEHGACDAPRRRWCLWRFASLIPSGCRLPPIHKVMGDHASRGTTAAGGFCRHVVSPDGHFRDTLLENCRFWATKCCFWDILCKKLKILFFLI